MQGSKIKNVLFKDICINLILSMIWNLILEFMFLLLE